jgi:hypothetical protein
LAGVKLVLDRVRDTRERALFAQEFQGLK